MARWSRARARASETKIERQENRFSRKLFQRLLDFQAQRFEPEDGERLLNCPSPNCIKMLVPASLVEQRADVNCPQCKQSFCAACTQPSHLGSCEEAELKRMDPAIRELMAKQHWKRCFEGAIGLRGPFGSVCMNKREPDTSLPSQPPPPRLSVVQGEQEGSIALRITFGDHRREKGSVY
eukprot:Skav232386  [mRNA]  locus=scaffold1077:325562:330093:- [translate_table: standard]